MTLGILSNSASVTLMSSNRMDGPKYSRSKKKNTHTYTEREKHIETHMYAQYSVSLEKNAWTHAYQRHTLTQDEVS